jgi:hypothetical protein
MNHNDNHLNAANNISLVIFTQEDQLDLLNYIEIEHNSLIIVTVNMYLKRLIDNSPQHHNFYIYNYDEIIDSTTYWEKSLRDSKLFFDAYIDININKYSVFEELLTYDGLPILSLDEIRYFSGHNPVLPNIFYKLFVMESIVNNISPDKIVIYGLNNEWNKVTKLICSKFNINLAIRDPPYCRSKIKYIADIAKNPIKNTSLIMENKFFINKLPLYFKMYCYWN